MLAFFFTISQNSNIETKEHNTVKVNDKRQRFRSKYAETKSLAYNTPVEQEAPKPVYHEPYKYQIVPFYSKDNNFPKFLYDVATMSPTVAAARYWKRKYVFGDGFKINTGRPLDMFAELQNEPSGIAPALQSQIVDFAYSQNGNKETLGQFTERILTDFLDTGNMIVVLRKFTVGSELRFNYWAESMKHCRLLMTKEGQPAEFMAIDPLFDYGTASVDIRQGKIYPLYPNFDEDGYSVIHIKNLVGGRMDYGLPIGFSSILHQIGEAKSPEFVNQLIDNRFISSGLLEVVEYEEMTQAEVNKLHQSLIGRWTNRGDKEKDPFGLRTVPDKDSFSKLHTLNHEIDVDFLKENSAENETKIISSEQWHPLFMGKAAENNLGGYKDEIRQVYLQLKAAVIQPLRNKVMGVVNTLLAETGLENVYLTLEDYSVLKDMEETEADTDNTQNSKSDE